MSILTFLKSIFGNEPIQSEPDATLDDINSIYNAIEASKVDGSFVVFMPCAARDGESDVLNIQFSRESGRLGLDWVLISEVNLTEKNKFVELCQSHKFEVEERVENGCNFLRVEGGDILSLCKSAIISLYPGQKGLPLDLVIEGFDWSKNV